MVGYQKYLFGNDRRVLALLTVRPILIVFAVEPMTSTKSNHESKIISLVQLCRIKLNIFLSK